VGSFMNIRKKVIAVEGVEFVALSFCLFVPAGTVAWPAAWVFLGLLFTASLPITWWLLKYDPGLVEERLRLRPELSWDKLFIASVIVFFFFWLILMPLDAVRFHWSRMPVELKTVGALLLLISLYISYLTMRENPYSSAVVRVQKDRGQTVISTGPYQYVRHPMYSGAALFFLGTALLLGSWYGVLCALVFSGLFAVRSVLEERLLRKELEGYEAYMTRVKYRFIPHVW
jgi:protein-S-isoprenylcysteine O-methyltransferase Ste14